MVMVANHGAPIANSRTSPGWLVRELEFEALTCGFALPEMPSQGGSTFEVGGTPHLDEDCRAAKLTRCGL